MRCEVCGRQIRGEPKKVVIEGAKMIVCEECAKLGSIYLEPEASIPKAPFMADRKVKAVPATVLPIKRETVKLHEETELIENFGSVVREAREKIGLSHEDLGRKLGEKVSVLKKIESEKMSPDEKLATKLEHALKVKLLVQSEEHKVPEIASTPQSPTLTLGEIARLKTGKRRNPENAGASSS